jgi:hypothetical protein
MRAIVLVTGVISSFERNGVPDAESVRRAVKAVAPDRFNLRHRAKTIETGEHLSDDISTQDFQKRMPFLSKFTATIALARFCNQPPLLSCSKSVERR